MWKAGLATFDDIKNDHQLGSESARSTYSLSRSKREKLTAVLEKQNAKPRVRTKMNRYRNSSSQEKLKNRRRNRNGKLVRSRGGNSDFSENKNHGVVGGGRSRLRKETSLPIPEDKPVEERNANSGVQIIIPEPIFFNGLNSIERPQWSLVETEDKTTLVYRFGSTFLQH